KNYLDKEQKKGKKIEEMYNSALLDFINNDYYLAMNKWEYILKKEPGNVRARYFLNRTLNILNRREPAIISDISQSDLKKINGLYYKGIIEYINGNYEKALLFWREILKIYPGHLRALYNINKIMLTLKKQR
ncbi:MAG: tetratricopeptide repeat protein, partial [Spirochaetes bacterium]|nr:tetratricopeptide repeat protein [Spirochaetota bacterium]